MDKEDEGQRVAMIVLVILLTVVVGAVLAFAVAGGGTPAKSAAVVEAEAPAPVGEALVKLFFESGKAELAQDAATSLGKVLELAKTESAKIVLISGFHDASGDPAMNAELAKQRALAVRAALTAQGLDEARIKLRKPETTLADGPAEEARRVELRVQ